jgi:hypothetical protein
MPQKLLKKTGKIAKKVVPPSRLSSKVSKQRKGACACACALHATPPDAPAAGTFARANTNIDKATADSHKARAARHAVTTRHRKECCVSSRCADSRCAGGDAAD